jgi:hypothetical protein
MCQNPLLAAERQRKRDELLALTEADLSKIEARVRRAKNPLRGASARRSARSWASARWPSTSR